MYLFLRLVNILIEPKQKVDCNNSINRFSGTVCFYLAVYKGH